MTNHLRNVEFQDKHNKNNCIYLEGMVFSGKQIMEKYITTSLETHLFFVRIMKEHSLFLLASFPANERNYRREADWYREQFELVLQSVVRLANGKVGSDVLDSGEVVTEYTQMAEGQTSRLTGIPIRMQITQAQERLEAGTPNSHDREMLLQVRNLNQRVMKLLNGLIAFKEQLLREVKSCRLYTANYPLLIEHILREAKWYRRAVNDIEHGRYHNVSDMETEVFWNQIMMEHAEFIRGLLDPTEEELILAADGFAKDFACLLEKAKEQDCRVRDELTVKTQAKTEEYRDFKAAGTKGITGCAISSVILPLLADHVLREANHYLRLLKEE